MGMLLRVLTAGLVWFCVATVLAQAIMAGYLWSGGWLDQEKIARMVLAARGEDLSPAPSAADHQHKAPETVNLADIDAARAARMRQIELREQATQSVLQQVRFETEQLTLAKSRFDRVYEAFKEQLAQDKVSAIASGNENARLLLEAIKPKQAKELIMAMLEADEIDEVVTLFESMPINKRAKIAAEFRTEEETKRLDEILRRIRRGLPDSAIIEQTQQALEQAADEPQPQP